MYPGCVLCQTSHVLVHTTIRTSQQLLPHNARMQCLVNNYSNECRGCRAMNKTCIFNSPTSISNPDVDQRTLKLPPIIRSPLFPPSPPPYELSYHIPVSAFKLYLLTYNDNHALQPVIINPIASMADSTPSTNYPNTPTAVRQCRIVL